MLCGATAANATALGSAGVQADPQHRERLCSSCGAVTVSSLLQMAVPAAQQGRADTQWPLTVKDRIFQAAREHQLRVAQRQEECKRRAQVLANHRPIIASVLLEVCLRLTRAGREELTTAALRLQLDSCACSRCLCCSHCSSSHHRCTGLAPLSYCVCRRRRDRTRSVAWRSRS